MKDIAFLEYTFMFDPSQTWSNLYQFENDLSKFFADRGYDAVIVKTVAGQGGRRILMLQPKPMVDVVEEPKKEAKPSSVGDKMRKLQPKK